MHGKVQLLAYASSSRYRRLVIGDCGDRGHVGTHKYQGKRQKRAHIHKGLRGDIGIVCMRRQGRHTDHLLGLLNDANIFSSQKASYRERHQQHIISITISFNSAQLSDLVEGGENTLNPCSLSSGILQYIGSLFAAGGIPAEPVRQGRGSHQCPLCDTLTVVLRVAVSWRVALDQSKGGTDKLLKAIRGQQQQQQRQQQEQVYCTGGSGHNSNSSRSRNMPKSSSRSRNRSTSSRTPTTVATGATAAAKTAAAAAAGT